MIPREFNRCLSGVAFLLALPAIEAQTVVIPQIADGGGWQTTIVVTNTTASTASAALSFYQDTSGGATQSWSLPLLEAVATESLSLPGGGTIFLHTPGTDSAVSQGWGLLQASSGVACYAIYTYRMAGHQDQDATAPGISSTNRVLVPFDNSSGLVTGVAVVNPTATSESVSVSFQTDTGTISTASLPNIPAQGHMAFVLPTQFPGTSGERGLAEFYTATGSLSIIALRANPTLAFTSSPVYAESGPPIIGSSPSSGISQLSVFVTFQPFGFSPVLDTFILAPQAGTSEFTARDSYGLLFKGCTVTNLTYTCNSLNNALTYAGVPGSELNPLSSASLVFTLIPATTPGYYNGTVSGSLSVTGGYNVDITRTLAGQLAGNYTLE